MPTERRSMHYARKRRICERRKWQTPDKKPLAIEGGKIVTLHDGVPVEFDHIHQLALGGEDTDDNLRPITPADHKDKTAQDASARGKVRRATGQNKPRVKAKIPSRGFQKHPTLKRDIQTGKVVPR